LNDHLVYKAADLPLVVDTLAALNVMLIKDRSRNPEWQAELQEQVALSVRQTDADLATQAKNAVLGQTLRQFADEGDTAALTALIKQLPELSVTYREVAVTALDAIQAQGNPRQYQTAYELQEAFLNEKIRFPAHVHVRYLEHVSNSNDISMVVNTFMRMKDNGIQPPRDTYATLTKTFGRTGNFKAALKVVEQMQASQQRPTLAIYHSIIQAVSRASDLKKLNRLLDLVEDDHIELNTVSYTLLARKHLRFGQPEKAATLMHTMLMKGLPVSVEAAETWLQALSEADTDLVTQLQHLHTHVTETELVVGLRFYYLFLRSIVNRLEARALEKRTDTEDSGDGANVKALLSLGWGVYDDMMAADINPSIEVLNMALALSGIECSLTRAQEVLQVIRSLQLQPQTVTYKYLADACGRADNLTAMQQTFDEYLEAFTPTDLSVFKVVIYHYGRHGNNDAAMKVYDEMIKFELVPDEELNEILVEVCIALVVVQA
jgi:pentatricopeptide repeat protein